VAVEDPVLNGPFDPPTRHFEIADGGPTGAVLDGRRPSESWIPVPVSRKRGNVQAALDLDVAGERREPNPLINAIRQGGPDPFRTSPRWISSSNTTLHSGR
jgi:type III restriction enzyme